MAKKFIVGSLTGTELRHIRQGLLMTQKELARTLGYAHKIRISEFERATNPLPIPIHIQEAVVGLWDSAGSTLAAQGTVRRWERAAA
jgi:transcriptional regulator with XRE-family HTH domain